MKIGASKQNLSRFALIYDQIRFEEKALIRAAEELGLSINPLSSKTLVLRSDSPPELDFALIRCISYFRGLHIASILNGLNISTISSFFTLNIAGNKLFATSALLKHGVKTPKTYIAFTPKSAGEAAESLGYPVVLKPVVGSWGRLIALIRDSDTADAIFEDRSYMYPLYQIYYLQEFVEKPSRDIRCIMIGGEPVAAIYRYSPPGDWKTNVAIGGRAESCEINDELAEISIKASEAVKGEFVGVDIMEAEGRYLVHEINPTPEFKATMSATGKNIAAEVIKYIKRKLRR